MSDYYNNFDTGHWSRTRESGASALLERRNTKPASAAAASPEEIEAALKLAGFRNKALLSVVSDLTFFIKRGGVITGFYAPKDTDHLLSADNLLAKKVMDLLPTSLGQLAMHYLEKALRTGQNQTFCCSYQGTGRPRDFQVRLARSTPEEVVATVRDVTDRTRLEKEIVESSHREQMRIGQDLHDGLGQHLTGITFLTRALEKRLVAKSLPEAAQVAEITRLVIQALTQTRSLARGLFPVEVESRGLVPALKELATTIEKMFSVNCQFESEEGNAVQDRTVAMHLFRLAQEAINNSIKHGKAKTIEVSLKSAEEGHTRLAIHDDGLGFEPDKVNSKGLGLRIMSYRAQKIGGVFEIQPGQQGGTVVSCVFPNKTSDPANLDSAPVHQQDKSKN